MSDDENEDSYLWNNGESDDDDDESEGLEDSDNVEDDEEDDDDDDIIVNDDESDRVARPELNMDSNLDIANHRVVVHSDALLEEIHNNQRFVRYYPADLNNPKCNAWYLPRQKTKLVCWSCAKELAIINDQYHFVRCPARHNIRTCEWELFGYFHGWGCVTRYCIDRPRPDAAKCMALIGALARITGYRKKIVPAPPVWFLKNHGGKMTTKEYLNRVECNINEVSGIFVGYRMVAEENIVCAHTEAREVDRYWKTGEFDKITASCANLETSPYDPIMPPPLFDDFVKTYGTLHTENTPSTEECDLSQTSSFLLSDSVESLKSLTPTPTPTMSPTMSPISTPTQQTFSMTPTPTLTPPTPTSSPSTPTNHSTTRRGRKSSLSRFPRNSDHIFSNGKDGNIVVITPTKRIRMGSLPLRPSPLSKN